MQISFTIPGRLKGKGRHRSRALSVRGKTFVQQYADPKTVSAEAMVRSIGAEAMRGRPPAEGPLVLDVEVTLNTPQSWSKKRKASAIYVTGKPDIDNVVKLLGDSLNGIAWGDDSQLCELHFRRTYSNGSGESTRVRIYPPGQMADEYIARSTPLFADRASA